MVPLNVVEFRHFTKYNIMFENIYRHLKELKKNFGASIL